MHRLLKRQLQRHFGPDFKTPPEWEGLLELVNQAYEQGDSDRVMLERSLELSSQELMEFHLAEKENILRKQIENVERERRHFKALADAVPAGVLRLDCREECNFVNQEWQKITGLTAGDAAGRGWWEAIHGGDAGMFRDHYERLVKEGTGFCCEHRVKSPTTSEAWVYCTAVAEHKDEAGQSGYIFSMVDITERKKSAKQVERSQRLESIGVLAGGIAHDLNNALAPIHLAVDLLKRTVMESDQRLLEVIEVSAGRGSDLARNLVTFARGGTGTKECISVKKLIDELTVVARASFPKNIEVTAQVAEGLPNLLANATQAHQVLLNLAVNARDAMPEGGRLTIEAKIVKVETAMKGNLRTLKAGDYMWIAVADTGMGMMPDVVDRIFEPFYSTKKTGTGFGLSNVAGIIKEHAGDIRVYSVPGRGTTFEIYLPLSEECAAPMPADAAAPEADGRGKVVLVADDEANIRDLLRMVLAKANYRTVEAENGAEAMATVKEMKEGLSHIITDLHMPQMGGMKLIRKVREVLPGIPIIVMTGRMEPGEREELKGQNVTTIVQKPFSRGVILGALGNGGI